MVNSSNQRILVCERNFIFYSYGNKYVKEYGLLSFARKYKKQLLDTGLDSLKTASKEVAHKAVGFLGNKISDAVTKSTDDKIEKQEPVE